MAIGNVVGTLSVPGRTVTSYELMENPGGFFAISGSRIVQAIDTPEGIYPVTIKAVGPGLFVTKSFDLDFAGSAPREFQFGVSIAGADLTFPNWPTLDEMTYVANRITKLQRITIGWAHVNEYQGPQGIQITPFGDLNPDYLAQSVTSLTSVGTLVTATVSNKVVPANGQLVPINGADQTAYNGRFAVFNINVVGSTCTFQYNALSTPTASTATGTIIAGINGLLKIMSDATALGVKVLLDLHNFGAGPGLSGIVTIVSITSVGTLATVTYSAVSGSPLVDGISIDIEGIGPAVSPRGASPYNGNFTIFNVTPTTFQYTMLANPGVSPAGPVLNPGPISAIVGGETAFIGSPRCPLSAFNDLWLKISRWVRANVAPGTVVAFEPMNEWSQPDLTVPFPASQGIIDTLRADGDNTKLVFDGNHFSSGWDFLDNNNDNLRTLVDPVNNFAICPHGYADYDGSGRFMGYSFNLGQAGEAPAGLTTNANILVQRAERQVAPWALANDLEIWWGESATSSDNLVSGGNDDYTSWNAVLDNWMAYVQAKGWTFFWWGNGTEFGPQYAFQLSPSSATDATVKDFSGFGVQPPQQVIIDKYINYTGPQPVGYRITGPNPAADKYAQLLTIGTPSDRFSAYYGGLIPNTIHLLPYANYASGVGSAGGSFGSPSFPPGENGLSSFTYTPTNPGIHQIGSMNDGALHDVAPAAMAWVREAPNPSGAITFPLVGVNLQGMNAATGCFPVSQGAPLPGSYRQTYSNYYFYRGFNCERIVMTRARVQPRLFGALDTGNTIQFTVGGVGTFSALQALDSAVNDCVQSGMTCIIDIHDFGGTSVTIDITSVSVSGTTATCTVADTSIITAGVTLVLGATAANLSTAGLPQGAVTIIDSTHFSIPVAGGTPSSGATTGFYGAVVGTTAYSNAAYADFVTKLAMRYAGFPKVMIDLQNEPASVTAAVMHAAQQAAITAARTAGYTGWFFYEGGGSFANASQWVSSGAAALFLTLSDPLNKTIAEVHSYVDSAFNGSNANPGPAGSGIASLISCTDHARAHGYKMILGEFGMSDVAGMIVEASAQLDHVSANTDVWAGWTTWTDTTAPYPLLPPEVNTPPFQYPPPGGAVTDKVHLQALMNHGMSSFYAAPPTGINMNWVPGFDGGFIPVAASIGTVLTGPMLGITPNIDVQGAATFALVSNPGAMFSINGSKQLVLAHALTDHTIYPISVRVTTAAGATAVFTVNVICESITTFDTAQCSTNLLLSGGNLTVTRNAGNGESGVRLTKPRTGGTPVYFEFLPNGAELVYLSRVWDNLNSLTSFDGARGEVNYKFSGSGSVFSQGAFHNPTPSMPTWGTGGTRVRGVWRPADKTIFLASAAGNFNNNPSANPSTNVGGISYATAGEFGAGSDAWYLGYGIFNGGNSAQFFMDPATWAFSAPSGCGPL